MKNSHLEKLSTKSKRAKQRWEREREKKGEENLDIFRQGNVIYLHKFYFEFGCVKPHI